MDHQEKLRNYIYQQIQSGLRPDEIQQQLRSAGWDEASITSATGAVQSFMSGPSAPKTTHSAQTPGQSLNPQGPSFTATGKKRGRIKTAWLLLKQSLKVLRNNKQLVRYPIMSGLVSILLSVVVLAPFILLGEGPLYYLSEGVDGNKDATITSLGYLIGFIYYVFCYFVIFLYNAGLTAHVLDIFRGKSENYHHYMKLAWSKKIPILVYSVITTTVGIILRAIEERSRLIGYIVSRILGTLWGLANLFTIPIIVENDTSAPRAIKTSILLFKSRWGENIAARITFGGLAFLIVLGMFIPILIISGMIFLPLGTIGLVIFMSIILLTLLAFAIIQSAASNILNTALYYYAKYQQIPAAFDAELLNSIFIPKKKRRGLFGKKTA